MVMTPEAWTVVGTGVVILIAIATSYRHLRGEMKALRDEFRGETNRIHTEVGGLRERMAKLEGSWRVFARRSPGARSPDRRAGRRPRSIPSCRDHGSARG